MIIYICNAEDEHLLDSMSEKYEWEVLIEIFDKASALDYIVSKLQLISNLEYMVISRENITEDEDGLLELIETVQCMFHTKFILVEENELIDEKGESQTVIYGERYIALYRHQEQFEEKLECLLTGEKLPEEIKIEGTWIGVMAANSGAGATDFSIGLTNYIRRYCQNVCYVEANESDDLGNMAEYYGLTRVEDNLYEKDGIEYRKQSVDATKEFTVFDLGKYNEAKLALLSQCKVKVLVSDGKPYRMKNAMQILSNMGEDTKLCLNYGTQEDFETVKLTYLSDISKVYRIDYHRDMFNSEDPLYRELLQNYIQVIEEKLTKRKGTITQYQDKLKRVWKKDENVEEKIEEDKALVTQKEVEVARDVIQPKEIQNEEIADEGVQQQIDEPEGEELKQERETKKVRNRKKKVSIRSNLILLLLGGALGLEAIALLPDIKANISEIKNHFFFNNQTTETAGLMVDEKLNINEDIKISVLEVEGADGYEVSYSTNQDFNEKTTVIVEVETADKAVESLTAGKTYYVRVRAFKYNENGTKVYGEYTEVQKIRT